MDINQPQIENGFIYYTIQPDYQADDLIEYVIESEDNESEITSSTDDMQNEGAKESAKADQLSAEIAEQENNGMCVKHLLYEN